MPDLPLLLEPEALEPLLGEPGLLVVDLGRHDLHLQAHIPGALHLEYRDIVAAEPPVAGLLPDAGRLSQVLGALGATPESHIVAYDDEGGGKAGRLVWTLHAIGHRRTSLLNGGIHAWLNEKHRYSREPAHPVPVHYPVRLPPDPEPVADTDWLLARLGDPELSLLDARGPDEFRGERRFSLRGGHIPGAVNFEWTEAMDRERNLRLKPAHALRERLNQIGVTPEREVVVYCQTHHRSALSYVMLKALGYPRVRGYHGSWSAWGNRQDTPVER